jgi:hypothetical protein
MTYRNARGADDDRRQIIADLIASDDAPFVPDDLEALNMSRDAILHMYRDTYLKPKKAAAKTAVKRTNCYGIDPTVLQEMVSNAVAEAVAAALKTNAHNDLPGGDPDEDPSADLEAMAKRSELDGNAEKARKLRKLAADRADAKRATATANALAYRPQLHAVTNGADDDEVKAMAEFNGDAAITKAINAKRERMAEKDAARIAARSNRR